MRFKPRVKRMQCTIPLDTDSINYTTSMDSETKQVSRLVLPARRLAAWFALGGGGARWWSLHMCRHVCCPDACAHVRLLHL